MVALVWRAVSAAHERRCLELGPLCDSTDGGEATFRFRIWNNRNLTAEHYIKPRSHYSTNNNLVCEIFEAQRHRRLRRARLLFRERRFSGAFGAIVRRSR